MDAWRIAASFFSADGQMLNAVTVGGILASIDLRPDLRSNQERQREVDVRSGARIDSEGCLSLIEAEEIAAIWKSQPAPK